MTHADYASYQEPRRYSSFLLLALIGLIAIAAGSWVASGAEIDAAAIVVLFSVTLGGIGVFSLASRNDADPGMLFQVLTLAWIARLAGLGLKLYIYYVIVDERADATAYHLAGQSIAQAILAGQSITFERFWSTVFVEMVTGFLYVLITPTLIGGWIIFNFLAMLGMLLHYKAFIVAFPKGNSRLFMLLIFFAPTLLMWTNTVGKDALVAFFLGMITYGVAQLYRRGLGLGRLVWTLGGLSGVVLVRPHVGAMVVAALAAAVFVLPVRAGIFRPLIRLAMLAAVVTLAVAVIRTSASFLRLEDLTIEGVVEFAEERGGEGTEQGGLAFEGAGFPTSPTAAAVAVPTVLFRPFPWETGNALILMTSVEGLGLLGLSLFRIKSVWRAIADARRSSSLAFASVFLLLFIIFFSPISNFGILIRQRAQLLPFMFIWLAYLGTRAQSQSTADPT